jgi:magnesium-protoporphyrin IX monomethyl ester (oxidative) cyclase
MFQQHTASLGLLRHLKKENPGISTVIGGANCASSMGLATHHSFPWVDFTITGEFDQHIVNFCVALKEHQGSLEGYTDLPPNVLGPQHRIPSRRHELPPLTILNDLDSAAVPDYDDYFGALQVNPVGEYVVPVISLETSRGCWWGAKHHCTFCGLNVEGMAFRKKSPQRALDEIRELTRRHGTGRWVSTDNIIDMSYFDTVLPELAADDFEYKFFYETKANLKRENVQGLSAAGCHLFQPGLESLHDETLRIMKKGTTACANIALLKHCIEFGVVPLWTILCGFPGADPEWLVETTERIPCLSHLPPPSSAQPIRFDRFSPYHAHAEQYGLELKPFDAYRNIYPVAEETLAELAYFFAPTERSVRVKEVSEAANRAVTLWRTQFWADSRPALVIGEDDGIQMHIIDTRPHIGSMHHQLEGFPAAAMRAMDSPVSRGGLVRRLIRAGHAEASDSTLVEHTIDKLQNLQLIWQSETQLIALPTAIPKREIDGERDCVIGSVDCARYFQDRARFHQFFGT